MYRYYDNPYRSGMGPAMMYHSQQLHPAAHQQPPLAYYNYMEDMPRDLSRERYSESERQSVYDHQRYTWDSVKL